MSESDEVITAQTSMEVGVDLLQNDQIAQNSEEERVEGNMLNQEKDNPDQGEQDNEESGRNGNTDTLSADEDWDLGSPLLPQRARRSDRNRLFINDSDGYDQQMYLDSGHEHQNGHGHGHLADSYTSFDELTAQEETAAAIAATAALDPKHFYYTIVASNMCMLFTFFVIGSFFFPWSDTMFHVSFDTIVRDHDNTASTFYPSPSDADDDGTSDDIKFNSITGDKIEFNVPLYSGATLQSTLAAFRSSDLSSLVAPVMLTFTFFIPALYMLVQCALVCICFLMGPPSSPSVSLQWQGKDPLATRRKWLDSGLFLKSPLWIMKFAMMIVYVYAILSACLSNVIFAFGGDFSPDAGEDSGEVIIDSNGSLNEKTIRDIEKAKKAGLYLMGKIVSESRGGMMAYLFGILCGIGAFMVLKAQLRRGIGPYDEIGSGTASAPSVDKSECGELILGEAGHDQGDNALDSNQNSQGSGGNCSPEEDIFRSTQQSPPPAAAFRFGDSSQIRIANNDNGEQEETQTPDSAAQGERNEWNGLDGLGINTNATDDYNDEDDGGASDNLDQSNDLSQPLLPLNPNRENDAEDDTDACQDIHQSQKGTRRDLTWSEILLFEASLFSFIFYIPLLFSKEPLMNVRFSGILTPVLDATNFDTYESGGTSSAPTSVSASLTFFSLAWDIATNNGGGPSSSGLFTFITWLVLWINVIIIPTISWLCCTAAFLLAMMKSTILPTRRIMAIPKFLHPMSHMTPFVMSIVFVASSLHDLSMYLFNDNFFCRIVLGLIGKQVDDNYQCLMISAHLQPMLYALLLQSLAMDYYITML